MQNLHGCQSNHCATTERKERRPKTEATPILRICAKCFARVGDELHDNCSSRPAKVDNVQQLLSGTPTTSQRVASRIIKETDTPYLSALGPKPLPLVTRNPPKKQLFTIENMGVIQKDLNLSNNKVVTLAEDLRVFAGSRNVIETGLKT